MGDITQLLGAMQNGDSKAGDQLAALVYQELKAMAAARMVKEDRGHTLQPTVLVHEVWLRLFGENPPQNRAHFFFSAARAMRQFLIEHARRKKAAKRGDGLEKVELDELHIVQMPPTDEVLGVDEILKLLEIEDPEEAKLVELRFFAGLTEKEAAEVMGISERTATNYWKHAKTWLRKRIIESRKDL